MSKLDDIIRQHQKGDITRATFREKLDAELKAKQSQVEEYKREMKGFPTNISAEQATKLAGDTVEFASWVQTINRAHMMGDVDAAQKLKSWGSQTKAPQSIGTDNLGGYTVPDELQETLVETIRRGGVVEQRARQVNMGETTRKVPLEGSGVSVDWQQEGDSINATSATFDQATLTAYRQNAYVDVSKELLADSVVDVAAMLMDLFTAEVAQHFDRTVFTGDGSASNAAFSGIFTATIPNSEVFSSSAFSSITVKDLINAYHKVPSHLRERGVFVGHPDVVKYLKLEQDSQNRYFWDPYAQASPSVHGRYPIVESDDAPNTDGSSEEAMAFANFRYLLVGSRAGMTTLIDPYTQSGNWRTRFTFVRRLGLAYAKKNAFCRLITA